jgi:anti-sigma B factor antagonist
MASIVDLEMEERSGVPVARLSGEIDLSVTSSLYDDLRDTPPMGAPGLVLDMSEVDYVDSAGLRLLLDIASRLEGRGQGLRLVVTNASAVARLLLTTGLDGILAVDHSVPDAAAALTARSDGDGAAPG